MSSINPEALVLAANAATSAQQMAQLAAFAGILGVILVLIVGGVTLWVAMNFSDLKHQTNSIITAYLKLTGEEALAKGDLQGRAALKAELATQSIKAGKEEKK